MTCREFTDFILDYMTGELPQDVRSSFERHLSLCHNCVEYLSQYEATVAAGREAFGGQDDALPGDVPEQLVQAILASRRS